MPRELAVGDRIRVTFASRMFNQNGLNVQWYQVIEKGAGLFSDLDFVQKINFDAAAGYQVLLNENAKYYGTRVQVLTDPLGVPQVEYATPTAGGRTGDPLPSQIACLVSQKTNMAGRHYRGRKYIPFASEQDVDAAGKFTAAYQVLVAQLLELLYGRLTFTVGGTILKADPIIQPKPPLPPALVERNVIREYPSQMRTRSQLRRSDLPPF